MSKTVYFYLEASEATREWVDSYGYDNLIVETPSNFNLRPKFRQVITGLREGDELIISRFSNVIANLLQMSLLIEFCRMRNIRLISVEERIDTGERLFGVTSALRMMQIMTSVTMEVQTLRDKTEELPICSNATSSPKRELRRKREMKVLSMYLAGHSALNISKKCNLTHAYIYRILKRNGVKCNRYPNRKPSSISES